MIRIVHKASELATLIEANAPPDQLLPGFDLHEWLGNFNHLALAIDNDLAMFEHLGHDRWQGHIWFRSRGKPARERASAILSWMVTRFGAKAIIGEIPSRRKDVCQFMARIGFKRIGNGRHPCGEPVVIVVLGNTPPSPPVVEGVVPLAAA